MPKVVLITGCNRGIGRGLIERYLKTPNHIIIAANRNPDNETSKNLFELPVSEGTKLILLKMDLRIWKDAFSAIEKLKGHNIGHIDTVIANAGVSYCWPTVADLKETDLIAHIETNLYGLASLYQAVRPLLLNSPVESNWVVMGTTAGSLNTRLPFPNAAYGPSKAAAAWLTIQINHEDERINSFALCPGWVHTDMGDAGAKAFKVDEQTIGDMMISVAKSCDGMMEVLSRTSKAIHGAKMVLYDGTIIPW